MNFVAIPLGIFAFIGICWFVLQVAGDIYTLVRKS